MEVTFGSYSAIATEDDAFEKGREGGESRGSAWGYNAFSLVWSPDVGMYLNPQWSIIRSV